MIEPLKNIIFLARRFKLATAFNLLGLIIAYASFYMMMTQIIYQATYNHGIEDYERLYRLDSDFLNNNGLYSDKVFYPFADALYDLPDIESISLVPYIDEYPGLANLYKVPFKTQGGDTLSFTAEYGCNKTAVSTLTSKVLSGNVTWNDQDTSLYSTPGAIIPRSIAEKYFNSTDVAGDSMLAIDRRSNMTMTWRIRGVYEDFPSNCELRNCIYTFMKNESSYKYRFDKTFTCLVKFKHAPQDIHAINKCMKSAIMEMIENEGWEKYSASANMSVPLLKRVINEMDIKLTPLKDSYFETNSIRAGEHGFKPIFIILNIACILLIIIAAIHFLNFTLVESPMRIRGINTRLVLGASRKSLRNGIMTECVITSVTASFLAVIASVLLLQSSIIETLIDVKPSLSIQAIVALVTLTLSVAVGIIASTHTVTFVTSIVPAMALKGNFGLSRQGIKLRKFIICCQLFIAFLMMIYLAAIIQQKRFIHNSPYHYNKDQVFMSAVPLSANDSVRKQLYKDLTAIGVKNASFSDGSLGVSDGHSSQLIEVQGRTISYIHTYVDTAYIHTLGIDMIKGLGRSFTPTDTATAIINKAALKQWPWIRIGSKIPSEINNDSLTIVGVCENIRYNSTRYHSNQPFVFIVQQDYPYCLSLNLSIDKTANQEKVLNIANVILLQYFGREARPLISFDEKLEETYENEFRFFNWIFILSGVCTFITLIGVLCLTLFESEYRRKEIGIRKVVGATTGEIVGMLCKQYIPLILLSFAIAVPVARYSGVRTLEYFADHTTIPWWIYPMALLIVGGIVMSTILLQSWRTARENPVHSIRAE